MDSREGEAVTRFKEVARDAAPILFVIMILTAICVMCLAIVGILVDDAHKEYIQRPDNYEVVETSSGGTIFTFCNHGARVWAIHSRQGDVAMTSQPGHGC